MSNQQYWENLLHQPVEIECSDGSVHMGIIESFDQNNVYLKPLSNNQTLDENESRGDDRFFGGAFGPQAFLGGFAGGLLGVGLGTIIGVRPCPFCPPRPGYWGGYGPRPPYGGGGGFYGPGPSDGSYYY
ncbi:hypothetical protein [Sporolactobacillus terrae]|uniref:LSM domain-containing protein n=1 Tax=Sporolactobacillus terrae TaxID=269673 RepID=A0A410D8T1_9BACL|nr:hypothetical protein [Sporolactobacillus terrae]QAA22494.1 hypothetical protein C0674_07565 [Sporolactobacillus terrae]QAA25468.1 hypothetical protein C0679_07545 [Sporolactobacillus terrae]UAK17278.1 hypothetical protein K7399_04885 [Sporolactobacillus terrae]BBN98804.1 hypothetical protein St703_15090 [Sporolactobacillus terrae]